MASILIVEDNDPLREVLSQIMRAAGHTVIEAETGARALAILSQQQPDVVLTDLVMPDQDGIGVIMTLRDQWPAIPVIAMSGGSSRSPLYLEVASKLGARRILSKPFKADELLEALREVGF